jgi:hypothetical protein
MPVRRKTIFNLKLIDGIFSNSVIYIFIGIPIFIAYGIAFKANIFYYIFVLIVSTAFLIIPTAVGMMLSMLVVKILRPKLVKDVIGIINSIFFLVVWLGMNFIKVSSLDSSSTDFKASYFELLEKLAQNSTLDLMPSGAVGNALLFALNADFAKAFLFFLPLLLSAVIVYLICISLAENMYYSGWSGYQESAREKKKVKEIKTGSSLLPVIKNDIKLLTRDTSLFTGTIFSALIAVIFPLILIRDQNSTWGFGPSNMFSMQLMMAAMWCSFMFSQTSSRLISMEGKAYWIMKVSPFSTGRYLKEKFLFAFISNSIIITTALLLTSYLLKINGKALIMLIVLHSLILSSGIACIGLMFGAIFPKFDWNNPRKMLKTSSIYLLMLSNSAYIFLHFLLVFLSYKFFTEFGFSIGTNNAISVLIAVIFAVIIFRISMYFSTNKLSKMEWEF